MPKVVYTATKGLVQSTGSGFEVSGVDLKQSRIECGVYLFHHAAIAVASGTTVSHLNDEGAYIIIADHLQKYVVWFQGTDSTSPATQPALGTSYQYVLVSAVKATVQGDIPALIKAALESATTHLLVTDKTSGAFIVEGKSPFAPLVSASVNAINSVISEVDPGLGTHASFTLNAFGSVLLSRPNDVGSGQKIHAQANQADTYVLPDGSYVGQEVTIIGNIEGGDTVRVTGKMFKTADDVRKTAAVATLTGTDTKFSMVRLVWAQGSTGTAWAAIDPTGVAIA